MFCFCSVSSQTQTAAETDKSYCERMMPLKFLSDLRACDECFCTSFMIHLQFHLLCLRLNSSQPKGIWKYRCEFWECWWMEICLKILFKSFKPVQLQLKRTKTLVVETICWSVWSTGLLGKIFWKLRVNTHIRKRYDDFRNCIEIPAGSL